MADLPITETLRAWLIDDGHADAAAQEFISVPDDKFQKLRAEAFDRHPNYNAEQLDAWAVMCWMGQRHMGKAEQLEAGEASAGIERIARAAEVQTQEWRKLRGGFEGLTNGLTAVERAVQSAEKEYIAGFGKVILAVSAQAIADRATLTQEMEGMRNTVRVASTTWMSKAILREKWLWAWRILILLVLIAGLILLVHPVKAEPKRWPKLTGRLFPEVAPVDHDVLIIRFKNEGTTIKTAVAGLVNLDFTGAGIDCSFAGNTVTCNAGAGGGGTTVTVNGSALAASTGDLDDATPAAAADGLNVKWQKDALSPTNISAYILMTSITKLGTVGTGIWNATIIDPVYGGTGANNAPTTGRYLRGDGTDFLTSSVAAAGAGSCTNQVVTANNDNAVPTCTTLTSAYTSGTFPATAHNILSTTHGDTTAGTVARGDGMFGIGVSPTWQRVATTTTDRYFKRNSSGDIVESTLAAAGTGTPTDCSNQFVTDITLNADGAPTQTCTTATLASAQFANQGTTSTVLHGNAAGNPSFGAIVTADITNDNVTRDKVSAVLRTRLITFILGAENGVVLVDGDDQPTIFSNRLGSGITITEVWCESDAGTPSVNLQRDDGTPANILSANLSCSTSGATGTIDGAEDNVANTERIDFVMVAAGGVAKRLTLVVKYTVD